MGQRHSTMESVERLKFMTQTKHKKSYIICAPELSGSAGVRVLYKLREELEKQGFNAKIFCLVPLSKRQKNENIFVSDISLFDKQNDIVIYPEIVTGNPLYFRNVVRFMLNKPGLLGGETKYHYGELQFCFDRHCHDTAPMLRFDMINRTLFFDVHAPKNTNCFFVHKGGEGIHPPELEGCKKITMSWPSSQKALAELLQQTDTLYSFDDNSCLLQEAVLCGAKVKIITPDGLRDYTFNDEYNPQAFKEQLAYFIRTTQQAHYTGPVNAKGYISWPVFVLRWIQWHLVKTAAVCTGSKKLAKFASRLKNESRIINGGEYVY